MKTDSEFLSALDMSNKSVLLIASWMASENCDVVIKPVVARPSFDSRNEFADGGDIEIRQRVEVKHRFLAFTNADDYPYETVIVDERYKIDRIPKARLYGYVIVNRDCSHACFVMPQTISHWQIEQMFDKKDRQYREFYVCPKELCSFAKIGLAET